jgi:hypothetical protein
VEKAEHGNRRKPKAGFNRRHTPLEIPQKQRDSYFSTAPTTVSAGSKNKPEAKPKTKAAA